MHLRFLSFPDEFISQILGYTDYEALLACRQVITCFTSPISKIETFLVVPSSSGYCRHFLCLAILYRAACNRNVRWLIKSCGTSRATGQITKISDILEIHFLASTSPFPVLREDLPVPHGTVRESNDVPYSHIRQSDRGFATAAVPF